MFFFTKGAVQRCQNATGVTMGHPYPMGGQGIYLNRRFENVFGKARWEGCVMGTGDLGTFRGRFSAVLGQILRQNAAFLPLGGVLPPCQ